MTAAHIGALREERGKVSREILILMDIALTVESESARRELDVAGDLLDVAGFKRHRRAHL